VKRALLIGCIAAYLPLWILVASMFLRELTLSAVLSRPGTEVLAVQIPRFSESH